MLRALGRAWAHSHISLAPVRPAWERAHLAPASASGFQLMQCVFGSACGWGWAAAAPAAASSLQEVLTLKKLFFNKGSSAMPLNTN